MNNSLNINSSIYDDIDIILETFKDIETNTNDHINNRYIHRSKLSLQKLFFFSNREDYLHFRIFSFLLLY